MKTVTIPACMNPYVVNINNHTYSYPAGETVDVPDEVAEVIEGHIDAQHAKAQQTQGSSSEGGSATKEWQKLLDIELAEATDTVATNTDASGKPFEVSELFFRVYMPAVSGGGSAYFRIGQGTKGFSYSVSQSTLAYLGGHYLVVDGRLHHIVGHISTTTEYAYRLTTPYGGYSEGVDLGADKVTSLTVGLTNNTMTMPVGTKIKVYGR